MRDYAAETRREVRGGRREAAEREAQSASFFPPILLLFIVDSRRSRSLAAGARGKGERNGSEARGDRLLSRFKLKIPSPLYLRPLRSRAHPESLALSLCSPSSPLFRSFSRLPPLFPTFSARSLSRAGRLGFPSLCPSALSLPLAARNRRSAAINKKNNENTARAAGVSREE